jgi:hypothetical protein
MQNEDRALRLAEALVAGGDSNHPVVAAALVNQTGALDTAGRALEATALLYGAIELSSAHGLVTTELRARSNLWATKIMDNPRAAHEASLEARELARRLGQREAFLWASGLSHVVCDAPGHVGWVPAVVAG